MDRITSENLSSADMMNPLYRTERKRYVMLLNRFEQYSVKPHIDALDDLEKELDRLKQRKDRRNLLQQRMEACRILQQVRVDLIDLARIKEQAVCPEDIQLFENRGEPLRVKLLRTAASILEKHPEVKRPTQEQEDILLNEEEKEQGYALANDELAREKDRLADQEDVLLRVETIHNEIEHVAGVMDQFWTLLEAQGKTVDTIEQNISEADVNVTQANVELSLAAKYKTGIYPLAGAIIGGVIGGPLGLMTGMKLAAIAAAATGTFVGYKGGKVLKRRTLMNVVTESKPRDETDIPQVDEDKIAPG